MTTRGRTLRLATRGSDLALRQTAIVAEALEARRFEVELVEVETTGDQLREELIHRLGKTGAFVRSLDREVLSGEVDAAVHSMKDVPTDQPDEIVVAGVPERAARGDVLVTPHGTTLGDLPDGATVGTSSLRRRAQLLTERPDLSVEPLRGNVDTRIEKLLAPHRQREHGRRVEAHEDERVEAERGEPDDDPEREFDRTPGEWFDSLSEVERRALEREVGTEYDAVVLARAGLERAGLLGHVDFRDLPPDRFVPAPGQGALAVTARPGEAAAAIREAVDDPRTRVETTVERTVLAGVGGGCVAPIGISATLSGAVVETVVRVQGRDGDDEVAATRDLPVECHPEAARTFAANLRDRGAAKLVERAKRDQPDAAKREGGT